MDHKEGGECHEVDVSSCYPLLRVRVATLVLSMTQNCSSDKAFRKFFLIPWPANDAGLFFSS